jgi:hypothetical protein
MPISYKAKLQRDGFVFEAEGDKKFVEELLSRYCFHVPLAASPSSTHTAGKTEGKVEKPATRTGGKTVPPGEFARGIGSSKHTDLVLAFGYYLEKVSGSPSFTPADINNCYYEAKMDPSNTSQMIILNIKKGFIMGAKKEGESEKKRYTLTRTGEEFVTALLAPKS